MSEKKDICCPKFNVEKWDKQEFNWENKPFITESTRALFHFPLPPSAIGKTIGNLCKIAKDNEADFPLEETILLANDPSPWKTEWFLAVKKEVPDTDNVKLSGTFLTKVFDGPYRDAPKWLKDMEKYVEGKGKKLVKYYQYYAYCPKCSKKYGHNYVAAFAQVE